MQEVIYTDHVVGTNACNISQILGPAAGTDSAAEHQGKWHIGAQRGTGGPGRGQHTAVFVGQILDGQRPDAAGGAMDKNRLVFLPHEWDPCHGAIPQHCARPTPGRCAP